MILFVIYFWLNVKRNRLQVEPSTSKFDLIIKQMWHLFCAIYHINISYTEVYSNIIIHTYVYSIHILLRFSNRTKLKLKIENYKEKTCGGMNQPHFIFAAFGT